MLHLCAFFFLASALYASAGFGGGSTYSALLVASGIDYRLIPSVALICNVVVACGGAWRFTQQGSVDLKRVWPFLLTSAPAAWLGARVPVNEVTFLSLLAITLIASGAALLFQVEPLPHRRSFGPCSALLVGSGIGALSGIVGIGGGIFLAPILLLSGWGKPRQVAGTASVFIVVNSVAGLTGQLTKLKAVGGLEDILAFWPLVFAVILGGQLGSAAGSRVLPEAFIRRLTALLIIGVALRILWTIAITSSA